MLTDHRDAHVVEHEKQIVGWQKHMKDHSQKLKDWAADGGKHGNRPQEPPKPNDFTEEYDRYLEMLKHHADTTILLDENEFERIVQDRFQWRHQFLQNSTMYGNGGI